MRFTPIQAIQARADRLASAARSLATAFALTAMLVACGGESSTPVTGVETLRPLSAEYSTRKAVNYSPYRTAKNPEGLAGEVITKANIKQDLDLLLAGGFKLIRLFDSSDKVAKQTLEVIRDNSLDIKVHLGAYLAGLGDSKSAYNKAEIARCIALANQFSSIVLAVSVGNEMLEFSFNRIDDPTTLADYITQVRNAINQPVTTDDTYAYWKKASHVVTDRIDFVSMHSYSEQDTIYADGLWDWQQLGVAPDKRAAAMMDAAVQVLKNQYESVRGYLESAGLGKLPIVIGETGWHAINTGNAGGNLPFRASAANQKMYYDRMRTWEAASRTGTGPRAIFHFEAFDEPWKGDDNFWGLFTVERKARCVIQALNPESATWVYDKSQPCDAASALYFKTLVVNAAVTASRVNLFSDVHPAGELVPAAQFDFFGDNVGGVTGGYALLASTAAPGDGPTSFEITPKPADYGWGALNHNIDGSTANLSAFASGALHLWIKTTGYPGKLQVGIATDTEDRKGAEAMIALTPGMYNYCTTGAWCELVIPIADFVAVNPKLDLRAVSSFVQIRDIFTQTGKAINTTGLPKLTVDGIYWSK